MSEFFVSDKFVNFYYSHLAFNWEILSNIYGSDSVVTYHDMEQVESFIILSLEGGREVRGKGEYPGRNEGVWTAWSHCESGPGQY